MLNDLMTAAQRSQTIKLALAKRYLWDRNIYAISPGNGFQYDKERSKLLKEPKSEPTA